LPTKLLEYVAVGVPSVVTRTRCVSRYFDQRQVELVEVGDVEAMAQAILRLAGDPKRRAEIVAAAREWQEEYGFEVQKRLFLRTVDSLCFEKIAAERKQKQQAVEGKKTGTRQAPPKAVSRDVPREKSASKSP